MKVLIVSTSERVGGAAIAASRLAQALQRNGMEVRMLVRDKQTTQPNVYALPNARLGVFRFWWERLCIFLANGFSFRTLFKVSIANTGADLTTHECFRWADVVHLHWVNYGMLSLADIQKMAEQGKPLVWTMHDMWNMKAIEHYPLRWTGRMFLLRAWSKWTYRRKERLYRTKGIIFVACSKWLNVACANSRLLQNEKIVNIPNAIDTSVFRPQDKKELREKHNLPQDKKLVLFGAMKLTDERKGTAELIKACRWLKDNYPLDAEQTELLIMGQNTDEVKDLFTLPVRSLGFLDGEQKISEVYALADAFVTPSLEDNLPNTIMEALACGTPCVGFAVGGIPEMIEHQRNGYVAAYKDVADLATGIHQTLFGENAQEWSRNARQKVLAEYSEAVVAEQYKRIYQDVVTNHKTIKR